MSDVEAVERPLRILYVAGREESYSRCRIVARALERRGHTVTLCMPPDRAFRHYPALVLRAARLARDVDVILVGFYGQLILPLIWLLSRKPIVFDMYITTYDTMVFDRAKATPGSLRAWVYGLSDRLSYWCATLSTLDNQHVIDHFGRLFNVDTARLRRLFLSVDDSVIQPRQSTDRPGSTETAAAVVAEQGADPVDRPFLVHFHGEYTPFHGVRHILRAAHLLRDEPIRFQLIGQGITYAEDRQLAESLQLDNVRFLDRVSYDELADCMARADVCLGVFGENYRGKLVITNKVVEAIGMAKPLITLRNAPVQELLSDQQSVYLVEPADPDGLAAAIRHLAADAPLRQRIAEQGYQRFLEQCSTERLGVGLEALLREALAIKSGRQGA